MLFVATSADVPVRLRRPHVVGGQPKMTGPSGKIGRRPPRENPSGGSPSSNRSARTSRQRRKHAKQLLALALSLPDEDASCRSAHERRGTTLRPMILRIATAVGAALALCVATMSGACAAYVVTFLQVGPDVVATGG